MFDVSFRITEMEKEGKSQRATIAPEADFILQWGNRKRLRCSKTKDDVSLVKSNGSIRKRPSSRIDFRLAGADKEAEVPSLQHNPLNSNGDLATNLGSKATESAKSPALSPEKEDRFYATRASGIDDGAGKIAAEGFDERSFVWPKFFVSLSCKEKEEDFMAMKGCKLPQRPKKRAKFIQKSIHVSMVYTSFHVLLP